MNKSLKNWNKISFEDYNKKEKAYLFFVVLYLLCHVFLGKDFSKSQLWNNLYLNDVYLLILVLSSYTFRVKTYLRSIQALLLMAVLVLVISLFYNKLPMELIHMHFRQFMMFFYLFSGYRIALVLNSFSRKENILLKIIIWVSIIGSIVQLLNVLYLGFSGELRWGVYKHYYSPLVILNIVIFSAFTLTYFTKWWRYLLYGLGLILSITVNHDSSTLAVLGVLACYLFFKLNIKQRIILSISGLVVMISLIIWVPNFSDHNASARLYYWESVISNSFSDGTFLFGNGFGKAFLPEENLKGIDEVYHRNNIPKKSMLSELRRYTNPPHNSFITIFFHLGIVGLVLLLLPLRKIFSKKKKELFIISSLLGLFIWASFNVILELPHSSVFTWLVFFCAIFIHSSKELSYDKN